MTLATPPSSPAVEQITLENVSWELYEKLVEERDATNQHFRITYDRGRMVIMSPLPIHERVKTFLGRFVELATLERGIELASYGSTTWKDRKRAIGMEPDECYYVGWEPQIDQRKAPTPATAPPPDLAIEVDISHHPIHRLRLYAQLGVKEVWRYDGGNVEIYCLDGDEYKLQPASRLMPFFKADDLNRFVVMFVSSGETSAIRAFRDWLTSQ